MTAVRDYYQHYWSNTGFAPTGYRADWKLVELFERVARSDGDTLDIGCGDGSASGSWLSAHTRSYVGVDVSAAAVELARARGLDARTVTDASELPFADASFDLVVIAEVLEHLFDPFGATVEARRVLRPGGGLIITVPNIAHWRNRADLALLGRWHPGGDHLSVSEPWRDPHLRFFTPSSLRAMLQRAGFPVADVEAYLPVGTILGRMPGLRRLEVATAPPGPLTNALVGLAPAALGTRIYGLARVPAGPDDAPRRVA